MATSSPCDSQQVHANGMFMRTGMCAFEFECARLCFRLQSHSRIGQVVPRIGAKALNTTGLVTSAHFLKYNCSPTTVCSGLRGWPSGQFPRRQLSEI